MKTYTEEEAAQMLRMAVKTLKDKMRRGEISYIQLHSKARALTEDHILEYLRANTRPRKAKYAS